jgi:hypothetical protein
MMHSTRRLALASLVLALGCDIALLPEPADYEGTTTPRVTLRVAGDSMTDMGVQAVDLELVDVFLHRESDDQWVWVGSIERVELAPTLADTSLPVPLPADYYDAVRVVIDDPRVAEGGAWHDAHLGADAFELPLELDLDGDHALELHFDLAQSLAGSQVDAWTFEPAVRAEVGGVIRG